MAEKDGDESQQEWEFKGRNKKRANKGVRREEEAGEGAYKWSKTKRTREERRWWVSGVELWRDEERLRGSDKDAES